jgi:hypothetical protein
MSRYGDGCSAGVQYGKNYRRTHTSWRSDTSVARKASDTLRGTYDYAGFFDGVIKGLKSFSSSDFEEAFNNNAQRARYKATALLGRICLQVETRDEAHYMKTLELWETMGAVLQTGAQHASV